MNEDQRPKTAEHEIGSPGDSSVVQPVSESDAVNETSDDHLGAAVTVPDPLHVEATLFGSQYVHCR